MLKTEDAWSPTNSSAPPRHQNSLEFEDNFVNPEALPDSVEYIASLERKLERIKKGRGLASKNLLQSLEERRRDCIARLLAEDLTSGQTEEFTEEEVPTKWLKSYLNPERALTVTELVELVTADYLDKEKEKIEIEKEKQELTGCTVSTENLALAAKSVSKEEVDSSKGDQLSCSSFSSSE